MVEILATALAGLCGACGTAAAVALPPDVEPAPAARFAIAYERSGGFAPMPRKLVIRPGRIGTVTEVRPGPNEIDSAASRFKLKPKTIEGLRRALARADFARIRSPGPDSGCSDCFLYEIRYRGHEVSFDQVSEPARLRPVLDRLEAIVEAHLPFH
jgi:hypothetical protein